MAQSRIELFAEMARQQPDDAMIWYGLASEYTKAERWNEAADALRRVVHINQDYTAAYQMLGTALMNGGRPEEAREVWARGVEVAARTGAWKARQHMEGLLADAEAQATGPEFCE
ncbi:MAG TPA: tetratricopeptide repeat protein [Pyrinomonadaceae bacterium]|nr:tetratricopeptide repeat protein [Pyrinomonadaceae bacterium]